MILLKINNPIIPITLVLGGWKSTNTLSLIGLNLLFTHLQDTIALY